MGRLPLSTFGAPVGRLPLSTVGAPLWHRALATHTARLCPGPWQPSEGWPSSDQEAPAGWRGRLQHAAAGEVAAAPHHAPPPRLGPAAQDTAPGARGEVWRMGRFLGLGEQRGPQMRELRTPCPLRHLSARAGPPRCRCCKWDLCCLRFWVLNVQEITGFCIFIWYYFIIHF